MAVAAQRASRTPSSSIRRATPGTPATRTATVGRLDPATGKITVYKMPDPNAKDPHTLIFNKQGIAFFTLQNSNMVGRLNPETGDIKLITSPVPNSKPYGIKVAADGAIWWSCNGAPCLFRMDPATMELKEYKLPLGGTTVRRLDIAEDGMIWYVNSGKGRIGRLDPKTGQATEWDSPSGPKLASLRDRRDERRRLVQRIRRAARPAGALRHQDRDVPELGDPVGRHLFRHLAAWPRDARRATCSSTRAPPTASSR